jgi:hypothetical protein
MKTPRFPVSIRRGSVLTRIYRLKRSDGREVFTAAWHVGGDRHTRQFADYSTAYAEATLKAEQLAAGKVNAAATVTGEDGAALVEARRLCGKMPILAALKEWVTARDLTAGQVIAAAEAWKARSSARFARIKVADAVDAFIKAKEKAKRQGERTYRAKLEPLKRAFPDQYLDAIPTLALDAYLEGYSDSVTRNDFRKRAVALWRWAYKKHHLPAGVPLEIEQTERAEETKSEIGIIDAPTFARLLNFIRGNHPEHLAALVLAGFCGIRADEIHGKRADRTKRQLWEDVHLEEDAPYVRVSNAKRGTRLNRTVPLCPAAIEWLMLCQDRKGPVCEAAAMEKVRLLARGAKFKLPGNAMRHSFITYRIDVTANMAKVALEAGNSEKEITNRYKADIVPGRGGAWFSIKPEPIAEVEGIKVAG